MAQARTFLRSDARTWNDETQECTVYELPAKGIFRILVCRITHSLGNTLLLTPLIRELEARFPGAEIDIVTRNPVAPDVFARFSVRHVFLLPAQGLQRPLGVLRTIRRMRATEYDLVIDPCPRSRTGRLMLRLAVGRFKLGFGAKGNAGLTHEVPLTSAPKHAGHMPVFLLRAALGVHGGAYPRLDAALTAEERLRGRTASKQLAGSSTVVGIFANATGDKWLGEPWWRRFTDALDRLVPPQLQVGIVEVVPASGRSLLGAKYPAYFSSDIRKLSGFLSSLSLFVSADCGVMHLACASGTPVCAIFSATEAAEWGPYGAEDSVVQAGDLSPEETAAAVALRIAGAVGAPAMPEVMKLAER